MDSTRTARRWLVAISVAALTGSGLQVAEAGASAATTPEAVPSVATYADGEPLDRSLAFADDGKTLTYLTRSGSQNVLHVIDTSDGSEESYTTDVAGVSPNGRSGVPVLSPDGRYLAFWSLATNLVDESDVNHAADLFVKDLTVGTVTRVNTGEWGTQPGGAGRSVEKSVDFSADSRMLTFETGWEEAWAYDIAAATATDLIGTGCQLEPPHFSADGSAVYVDLSQYGGAPDLRWHVSRVDLADGQVRLISADSYGDSRVRNANFEFDDEIDGEGLVSISYSSHARSGIMVIDAQDGRLVKDYPKYIPEEGTQLVRKWGKRSVWGLTQKFLNPTTGKTFTRPKKSMWLAAASPDGRWVAWATGTGAWPGTVRLQDMNTGRLGRPVGDVRGIDVSDSGMMAVTRQGHVQVIR